MHEALNSSGQPLDAQTRSFMESRFGHDFSRVRVHTDARAAESARSVNALAYTVGHDVVFAEGSYAPQTGEGRRLLAHELTHVVQQRGGQDRPAARTGGLVRGHAGGGVIQRQPAPAKKKWKILTLKEIAEDKEKEEARQRTGQTAAKVCMSFGEKLTKENCPAVLAPKTEVTVVDKKVKGLWLEIENTGFPGFGPQQKTYILSAFAREISTGAPKQSAAPGAGPSSAGDFESLRKAELLRLAKGRSDKAQQEYAQAQMQATVGHLQVGRGVFGNVGGGGALQATGQALGQPFERQILAVDKAYEELVRDLEKNPAYTFVSGFVDGVRANLDTNVFAKNAGTFAKLVVTWPFNPKLQAMFLYGTAKGLKKEIEGLVDLIKDFDEIAGQLYELAKAVTSEGGAEVTRAIGNQLGAEWGKRLTELGGMTDLNKLAEALGETFGPLLVELAIGIATAGSSTLASVGNRIKSLLKELPKLAKFLEKLKDVRKLRLGGKGKVPKPSVHKPHLPDVPDAPDLPTKTTPAPKAANPLDNLNQQTRELFEKRPDLKKALEENPLAARALKYCQSPCFPSFTNKDQIKRINDFLARAQREGIELDQDSLRKYFHRAKNNDELDGLIERLQTKYGNVKGEQGLSPTKTVVDEADLKAQDLTEVKKPGGGQQKVATEVGNWAHKYAELLQRNPEVLKRLAKETGGSKIFNKKLPDGLVAEHKIPHPHYADPKKPRIDRLWRKEETIFEIKPNTLSAERGKFQAQQYAEWMDKFEPLPDGRKWKSEVIEYDQAAMEKFLRGIGVLK
ncbi:MAG TPA: DUF4157 domain-containing protein [Pyrinomonadaceae bacterium]|nr:DUF4157 domain-containing protein [Pyrinomonadaceae bacterium]